MANKYAQATANWSDLAAAAKWFDAASGGNAVDGPAVNDTVYLNGQTVHIDMNLDLADSGTNTAPFFAGPSSYPSAIRVAADETHAERQGEVHDLRAVIRGIGTVRQA